MSATVLIAPLDRAHDRHRFACGSEPLDRYIRVQAGQDARRHLANCFVAVREGALTVIGYYTLSAASVSINELPEELAKRLPRYPALPAALIGRFAVDSNEQGRQVGKILLFDAIRRARRSDLAAFLVLVEAKDEAAAAFYRHFEFRAFAKRSLTLFLPVDQFGDLPGM